MLKTLVLPLALVTSSLFAQQPAAPPKPAHRIFIVDNVAQVNNSNVTNYGFGISTGSNSTQEVHGAPIIMAEFQKRCPAVTITLDTHLNKGDYILEPQTRASRLLVQGSPDVAYISPAFKVKNLVKDVCKYIQSH